MGEMTHRHKASTTSRVYKALGVFSGTQSIGILCSVIRTKMVALWIGASGVGLFGIYNTAIELISSITQLSMRSSAVRDLAAQPAASAGRRIMETVVRRWALILGLLGMALTAALSPLLAHIALGDKSLWWAFALLSPVMLLNSVTSGSQAVMQADSDLRTLAKVSVWGAAVALGASVPILYYFRFDGIIPVIVIYSLSSMAATLLLETRKPCPEPMPTTRQTMQLGRGFIRLGAFMTLSGAMVWGATFALMAWLRSIGGETAVGFYQAGTTILVRYAGILFTAIGMEYYPRIAAAAHDRKRLAVYANHETLILIRVALPLAICLIILAPWIVELLFSDEFHEVAPMITAGTVGLVARVASWCLSFMMIVRNDGRVYMATEISSVILFLTFNVIGYHIWGITGLGYAFTAWYLSYLAIVWAACRIRYGFRFKNRAAAWLLAALVSVIIIAFICLAYRY